MLYSGYVKDWPDGRYRDVENKDKFVVITDTIIILMNLYNLEIAWQSPRDTNKMMYYKYERLED